MPFTVQIIGEGHDVKIELADTSTNTIAEVYPFGAILNKFLFEHPNGTLNVIDGYESLSEARRDVAPLFKSAKLTPFVCRVKNAQYYFGQEDHHLNKFLMNGSAIHGLIYDQVFDVIETSDKGDFAMVKLQYEYNRSNEGYPFKFRCNVNYLLLPNRTLSITTEVVNIDNKLIPVADGWHPYFTLGDVVNKCQLEFQSKEMLEFDENLVPTGKLIPYQEFGSIKDLDTASFDSCFTANFAECQPMIVFRNPRLQIQLEVHPDPSYPYIQIFTPDHRRSIAIENLSAAPDAFNNGIGLKVLEPGESATFNTKYVLKSF